MLAHLGEGLLPFWLEHCVDEQHGGFLLDLDREGRARSGEKLLIGQARTIGMLARLWREGYHDPRIRHAAEQGLEFLAQNFNDDAEGGWFCVVARDGAPVDMRKSIRGQAAVIQAMAEYYRAFDDRVALRLAKLTFDTLERHARDDRNGGYWELMSREWASEPADGGQVKTAATHLALMEAFTDLYLATDDPTHAGRARETLELLANRCCGPGQGSCPGVFRADWQPVDWGSRRTFYALDAELAWAVSRTAEALGLAPEAYQALGLALVDHAMRYGWDAEAGALCYWGPVDGPATDRRIDSATQAESAAALDWAWRATGEERYLAALRSQVAWVLDHQADPVHGGWYNALRPDGGVESAAKGDRGLGPFREMRACLNVGLGGWQ
jgi:mannose/cellobiose epimerase-like protein (N-acyl-D-glucosamine 2-epimerase family)